MNIRTKILLPSLLSATALLLMVGAAGALSLWMLADGLAQLRSANVQRETTLRAMDTLDGVHISAYRTLQWVGVMDDKKIDAAAKETLDGLKALQASLQSEVGGDATAAGAATAAAPAVTPAGAATAGAAPATGAASSADAAALAAVLQSLQPYAKTLGDALDLGLGDKNTGLLMMQTADRQLAPVRVAFAQLDKLRQMSAEAAVSAVSDGLRRRMLLLAGVTVLVAIATLALAMGIARRITAPLMQAISQTRELAEGKMVLADHGAAADETGDLKRALAQCGAHLSTLLGGVRRTAAQVGNSAAQIASGNAELLNRTERQSSALHTTVEALQGLRETVERNADHAGAAATLGREARGAAAAGGTVVASVVGTMNELNASSSRIREIIGTIDGIAFQTNILALNAAVEAARAGDQGRGFAVVATEVRTLAQRSSRAAGEIRSLIGRSVELVASGNAQADQAGESMNRIAGVVDRLVGLVDDIAEASRTQSKNVQQVGGAVDEIDKLTRQNANLAQQASAAAGDLHGHAEALDRSLGVFRLAETTS